MSLLRNGNVIGGISKTLLSKIGFSDLTTGAQNLCDGVNELNSSKVSKSGDTMTGNLNLKNTSVDASQTNNGVSSIQYPTSFHILDNETRTLARVEAVINPNGNIGSYWYVRNYNTSGEQVAQKGIAMHMNKSGGLSYSVSDGEAFATAIGKYTRSSVGTLDWDSTNQQLLMTKSSMAFWNGAYSGTASNLQYCDRGRFGTIVTKNSGDYLLLSGGTMTGAIAFNNATTRRSTAKNLTSENVTSPGFVVSLTDNWGTFGYSTIAQLKSKFGYGNIVGYNIGSSGHWWSRAAVVGSTGVMEIGQYIDFHATSGATSDYNFRFTALGNGNLQASGSISQGSSYKIKENIEDMTLDEAEKILSLKPVKFDYIEGSKNQMGFIAEDVGKIIPNLYFEEEGNEDDRKMFTPASLNYIGMIPYLVKVCQIQQKKIEDLEAAIKTS